MNRMVTSREELLAAAKEIARREGISRLNIRSLAACCKVSVGSIYNYFPTKSDLVVTIIEDFWKDAFHGLEKQAIQMDCFPDFFQIVYVRLWEFLQRFENGWLSEISQMEINERRKGKKAEAACFLHIQKGFVAVLGRDEAISKGIWKEDFSKEAFAAFAFDNMLSLLKRGERECGYFCDILKRLLYSQV